MNIEREENMRKETLNIYIMLVAFIVGLIISITGNPLTGVLALILIMSLSKQLMKFPPLRDRLI